METLEIGVSLTGAEESTAKVENLLSAQQQLSSATKQQGLAANQASASLATLNGTTDRGSQVFRRLTAETSRARNSVVNLVAAEQQAATSVNRATASLNQNTAATQRAQAATTRLTSASGKTAKAGKAVARSQGLVSKESKSAGLAMALQLNSVAELGFSLSTAVPAFRAVGVQMAIMGGSAFGLANLMGPLGVGLSVVIGLVPVLISLFGDAGDETDELATSTEALTDRLQELEQQQQQTAERRSRSQRAELGLESLDDLAVREREAILRRQDATDALNTMLAGFRATARGQSQVLATLADDSRDTLQVIESLLRSGDLNLGDADETEAVLRLSGAVRELSSAQRERSDAQREILELQAETNAGTVEEAEVAEADAEEERRRRRRRGGRGAAARARREAEAQQRILSTIDGSRGSQLAGVSSVERNRQDSANSLLGASTPGEGEGIASAARAGTVQAQGNFESFLDGSASTFEATMLRLQTADAAMTQQGLDSQKSLAATSAEAATNFADSWRGGVDSVIEAFNEMNEAAEKSGDAQHSLAEVAAQSSRAAARSIGQNLGKSATSALDTHVDAWLSGEESIGKAAAGIAKSIVKSLVQQSIVQSVFEFAQALASIARFDPVSAAAHAAAGVAFAAIGAVAGGVGLATGAVGGGGAGAGASRDNSAGLPPPREEAQDRVEQTIVLNIGGQPLFSSADAGAFIEQARDAFARRDGVAI